MNPSPYQSRFGVNSQAVRLFAEKLVTVDDIGEDLITLQKFMAIGSFSKETGLAIYEMIYIERGQEPPNLPPSLG